MRTFWRFWGSQRRCRPSRDSSSNGEALPTFGASAT